MTRLADGTSLIFASSASRLAPARSPRMFSGVQPGDSAVALDRKRVAQPFRSKVDGFLL
jgi:hypothetical protein